jgi:hypothetical protein
MKPKEPHLQVYENIRALEKAVASAKEAMENSNIITDSHKVKFDQICLILETLKTKSLELMESVESNNQQAMFDSANMVFKLSLMIKTETQDFIQEILTGVSTKINEKIH